MRRKRKAKTGMIRAGAAAAAVAAGFLMALGIMTKTDLPAKQQEKFCGGKILCRFLSDVCEKAECLDAEYVYKEGFSSHKIGDAVKLRIQGISYKENRSITLDELRYIRIKYYDFDGNIQKGELIVNRKISRDILEIFYDLYENRYPLERVSLIDEYGADDEKSMEANNTSAFNYRVIAGTEVLSCHASGMAVDINPRINPCVTKQGIAPENGECYVQRDVSRCTGDYKNYMIQEGDYIYRLFKKHGFQWGGDWISSKDYQHFEKK